MSEARKIADGRLAKGEITQAEHASLITALHSENTQPPSDTSDKEEFNARRKDLNLAWMWLIGGVVIFLCVKVAVDKVVASGDPVKWGLVYTIYAVCACLVFFGFGGILASKKE